MDCGRNVPTAIKRECGRQEMAERIEKEKCQLAKKQLKKKVFAKNTIVL